MQFGKIPLQYRPCIVDNFCAPTVPFMDTLLEFYRVIYVFYTICIKLGSLTTMVTGIARLPNLFWNFHVVMLSQLCFVNTFLVKHP